MKNRVNQVEAHLHVHSAWSNENAQVDLIIKRADRWVNLCEMKFHNSPFQIDKKEAENLRNKVFQFKQEIGSSHAVTLTFITTIGTLKNSYYHELVENEFTMEILFEE